MSNRQEKTMHKVIVAMTMLYSIAVAGIDADYISFGGLTNADLNECWGGMGRDSQGRIYVGFTGYFGSSKEDFGVFRWDPATGEREFLGSFRQIADSFDNLPNNNEEMPKGHTEFILRNDILYMGSQGFHDFKNNLDGLDNQRGGRLFAFDTRTDAWDDISSRQPGGVMLEHDGLLALSMTPDQKYIAAMSHPTGKVLLYNPETDEVEKTFDGIPWSFGYNVARQFITEKPGKIYVSRNHEWPNERNQKAKVWEYDIESGQHRELDFGFKGGFLNGKTPTSDGSKVYLTTTNGEVYVFHVATGEFEHLGHFLPESEYNSGKRIRHIYGHVLSLDEKKLYAIQSWTDNNLYEFNVETKKAERLESFGSKVYVSYNLRDDQGNIYFVHWDNGEARLMKLDVSDRTGPAPVYTAALQAYRARMIRNSRFQKTLVLSNQSGMLDGRLNSAGAVMINGRRLQSPRARSNSILVTPARIGEESK